MGQCLQKQTNSRARNNRAFRETARQTFINRQSQVKRIIQELRVANGTAIVLATARDVTLAKDANLLVENGGSIDLSKDWAKRLLSRMRYVKRKAT